MGAKQHGIERGAIVVPKVFYNMSAGLHGDTFACLLELLENTVGLEKTGKRKRVQPGKTAVRAGFRQLVLMAAETKVSNFAVRANPGKPDFSPQPKK